MIWSKAQHERAQTWLGSRQSAYRRLFAGPNSKAVLEDLAKFCRAHTTTFDPDPRVHAAYEGRREVFLRIQEHLKLSPDQLFELTTGQPAQYKQVQMEDET